MSGVSIPQGLHLPPRVATLFVAASNGSTKARAQADYLCDGVSDQVEINAALNALPAAGGRVILSEGTFTIDDPITFPASNLTLEGQGRGTFIDGDGLATGEHGIVISYTDDCMIKNLAIQTEDGGGKTSHCIYVEGGARTVIDGVTIIDSDSDGIHILDIWTMFYVRNCSIIGADDNGVNVVSSANDFAIYQNYFQDVGGCAILLDPSGYFENGIISQNVFRDCVGTAINIGYITRGVIADNAIYSFYGAGADGIFVGNGSERLAIVGNSICDGDNNGINLSDISSCEVDGNTIYGAGGAGIYADSSCWDFSISSNYIDSCKKGIQLAGGHARVIGNYIYGSYEEGIYVDADYCSVVGNYVDRSSMTAAGSHHGIHLTANADLSSVIANFCTCATSGYYRRMEDGIHLADGCVMVNIVGNHCSWGLGSGIALEANNDDCNIQGNYCYNNDDYGIEITAATCNKNAVRNNYLIGNTTGPISDAGTLTTVTGDNEGIEITDIKVYRLVKNTSGAQRVAGDVVSLKAVAAGNEVTTPAAAGEDDVYGMVAETIANNASGYVLVKGKTTVLKATNANGNIAVGDTLSTEAGGNRARLAAAGDQGFARALEACAAADCTIDAYIKSPWD